MGSIEVILRAWAVRDGFAEKPDFLGPVDLQVSRGRVLGLIGPNGAGKTILIRLLAGLRRLRSGRIEFEGADLGRLSPLERARGIAYLPQKPPVAPSLTVSEVVFMGRFPHRRYGLFESADDARVCRRAMGQTGIEALAERPLDTLSGGEAQRVFLAAALAQEPRLLLLDEPTAGLDLYHQLAVFELLRQSAREQRIAVVVVTHDLNLAGRFSDELVLLHHGKPAAAGPPAEVLTDEVVGPVYGVRFAVCALPGEERPWILPQVMRATPHGEAPAAEGGRS